MKALILKLADEAEPLEAGALREVAENYNPPPELASRPYEMRYWHIILLVLAIYAIWTPIYFFGPQPPVEGTPKGRMVEQLSGFVQTPDGRYTTRTYKFARGQTFVNGIREWTFFEDPVPLVVYEGSSPLPRENYELQKLIQENIWRFVTIKTSDGSDPRRNGRRYFIVLP